MRSHSPIIVHVFHNLRVIFLIIEKKVLALVAAMMRRRTRKKWRSCRCCGRYCRRRIVVIIGHVRVLVS